MGCIPQGSQGNPGSEQGLRNCTLVTGNGFSIDFVSHTGMGDRVRLDVNSLLPPPPHVLYLPGAGDPITSQPLWNGQAPLFPLLADELQRTPGFWDLCESLAKKPLNRGARDGKWTIDTREAGYQLRVYLWYLFKYYDLELWDGFKSRAYLDWRWTGVIAKLLARTNLTCISYNYDCILECVISQFAGSQVHTPWIFADKVVAERQTPAGGVLCLKPHGSVSFYSRMAGGAASVRCLPDGSEVPEWRLPIQLHDCSWFTATLAMTPCPSNTHQNTAQCCRMWFRPATRLITCASRVPLSSLPQRASWGMRISWFAAAYGEMALMRGKFLTCSPRSPMERPPCTLERIKPVLQPAFCRAVAGLSTSSLTPLGACRSRQP